MGENMPKTKEINKREIFSNFFPFWNKIDESSRTELLNATTQRKYLRGAEIKSSNSYCIGGIYIISGRVRAYITSDSGKEITLYYLTNGDFCTLSAGCVMPAISFEIQMETEEDTELFQIFPKAFAKAQEQYLEVENFALKVLLQRFSDLIWELEQFHSFSIEQRVAMFLYDEYARNKNLVISVTHEQIAKNLASAREVISRQLKEFEGKGIVKLGRGKITILNVDALRKIV